MALVLDDRVRETSTTTGTGTLNLDGAVSGFQTFVAGVGNSNTTYYAIIHRTEAEWELGVGTVTDASTDTLARTTVLSSSNSDSAVSFSAGTKDVFVTQPASKAVYEDAGADVTLPDDLILGSDSAVLKFGADSDTTLTHTDGTGLTLNSTNKLTFQDTGTYIYSNADGDLDVVSDGTAVDSINLESAGGITLDAGTAGSGVIYEDDGTEMMRIHNSSSDVIIESKVSNKDIIFKVNDGGSSTEVARFDGDVSALLMASGKELRFADSGEKISGNGTNLTLNSGADINLTATTDINVPANVGVTFGDDAEKIEGDGTDLTISGNNINLTATADVVIPANVGVTFGSGEKIEGDSTDLTITSGGALNLTATTDVVIPANVGITFGTGEKIEGDSTDLTVTSGGALNLTATTDVVIPANVGITFGTGEKIEGDSTDLTVTSGGALNLTATTDVVIPANVGITFGTGEKIEGDNTDLTVTSGAKINLNATSDVHIPNDVGIVFGGASEKIEGDGTDLVISANNLTVDAAADIILDAAGNNLTFKSDGTSILDIADNSSDVELTVSVADKNFAVKGTDGSSAITALDIDMALAGKATFNGAVVVGGNLTVNGTTSTVNSTTMTVDDPIITLGGDSAPGSDDNKDRGVEFRYHDGSSARIGFMGYDDSATGFTFLTAASNSSEVFSGTAAKLIAGELDISGDVAVGDDLSLDSDAAVLNFGADSDVNLTHVADTGLLLNAAMVIQFRDSGLTIGSNADGDLDIVSDGTAVDSINIESAGGITLDAGTAGSGVIYEDDGTEMLRIHNSSSDVILEAKVQDKDILFKGDDGGSGITALTLDMSAAGAATFNDKIVATELDISGDVAVGDDLSLDSDAAVLNFGADSDVSLTHVADTALLLNSSRQLQFGDSGTYIHQSADGVLDLVSDTEIEINATTIDINGNVEVSGDLTVSGDDITMGTNTSGAALIADGTNFNPVVISGDIAIATNGAASIQANSVDGTHIALGSDAAGDIMYYNGTNYVRLAKGDDDQVLTLSSGIPSWAAGGGGGSSAADDITAGDAAVTITTSSGNITIDAQANDSDIILKGTDGGADTTFLTIDGSDAGTLIANHNLELGTDSSEILFGADNEVKLIHNADKGLILKHTATADDKPVILTLQTGETDIAADDVIGKIEFQAPDEGTGTDAILVAAGIQAVSEGDFSSSNNATKLSFLTGASEAAAEKMSLSSAGLLTIADDLVIKDGGTIGVSSDADAITIASNGAVTLTQALAGTSADFDGGVTIDNITIDGTEIDLSSGDLTLDVEGDIVLDANGADIHLYDNGSAFGRFTNSSSDLVIQVATQDKDILFKGDDGGSAITGVQFDMSDAGAIISKGNVTAFGSPSDIRLKENIEVIPNALDKVSQLQGITFNYKKDGRKSTGLIAQELEKVLPEVVYDTHEIDNDDEKFKAVRYGNVVGLLVEAIKELKAEVKELKEAK